MQSAKYHPYAGFGMTLNQIGGATFNTAFSNPVRYQIALDSVQSKKASFSPVVMGGLQVRLQRFSVFGQVAASPVQQGFFLYNSEGGPAFSMSLETGIRYNFGSSIDRAR
jgi:hypothetical protein